MKIADSGEVMFRSPGVFTGYYKDPERTAETKQKTAGCAPAMPASSTSVPAT